MDMLSLGINGFRLRDPPTDPSRITRGLRGYTHRVRSRVPSGQGIRLSPSTPAATARGSGTRSSLRLLIDGGLGPILGSLLAFGASQGPGTRRCAPSSKARGAPRRCSTGTALSTTPPTGSRTERTQGDKLLRWLQGLGGS
jgi:hypothetical protein